MPHWGTWGTPDHLLIAVPWPQAGPTERGGERARTCEECVKPALSHSHVSHAVYGLVAQDSGKALAFRLWQSVEAASPTEAPGAHMRALRTLSEFLECTVRGVERSEVAAQDGRAGS